MIEYSIKVKANELLNVKDIIISGKKFELVYFYTDVRPEEEKEQMGFVTVSPPPDVTDLAWSDETCDKD